MGSEGFCKQHDLFKNGIVTKLSPDSEKAFAESLLHSLWDFQEKPNGVVLAPTFLCNLDCSYCYQKDYDKPRQKTMSFEEIQIFLTFLQNNNINRVTLFGGEPLLMSNYDRLEPVLKFIKTSDVSCYAVTNGTELDAYSEYMGADCISRVQITLDGDEEHHDAFRKKKNGKGSWRQIYSNIKKAIECGVFVSVRMNVNSKNLTSCQDTKIQLEKKYKHTGLIECYLGRISGEKGDLSYHDKADSLYHPAMQHLFKFYPNHFFPKSSYCSKTARFKSLIFAPTGIWDCWHHAGDRSYKIGDYAEILKDDGILHNLRTKKLLQFSAPCITCKYLFICAGDCLVFRSSPGSCDKERKQMVFYENILHWLKNHNTDSMADDRCLN